MFFPQYSIQNNEVSRSVVTDAHGYAYVVTQQDKTFITKLDPAGNVVYRIAPIDPVSYTGIILTPDGGGNVYVSGGAPGGPATSVVKLDPAGAVVYRFTLPAAPSSPPAIGPDGSAYFTGSSDSLSNWQTTPGAWVPTSAGGYGNVFVIKPSPAGDRIVYATLLDNGKPGYPTATSAQAIAVDAQGFAYVTGTTKNPNFPITPGVYQAACGCATEPAVFVAKLSRMEAPCRIRHCSNPESHSRRTARFSQWPSGSIRRVTWRSSPRLNPVHRQPLKSGD